MMLIAVSSVSICRSANPTDVARHNHMALLAKRMLSLHKRLRGKSASREDGTAAARSMGSRLYALTEEEISIVEDVGS
jgi:hypothetical protein